MGNKINVVWKFAKVLHSCASVASMVDASPFYAHLNIHSGLKLIQWVTSMQLIASSGRFYKILLYHYAIYV
jgi:hypothetical protein